MKTLSQFLFEAGMPKKEELYLKAQLKLANRTYHMGMTGEQFDQNAGILTRLIDRSDTHPEVLRKLSKNRAHGIRFDVAKHSNTPDDVLARLAREDIMSVANAAKDEIVRRRIIKSRV